MTRNYKLPLILEVKEILLNNTWVQEIIIEVRKYLELNPNENITHQNIMMQYVQGSL